MLKQTIFVPLEEEEVQVVVILGEEVTQNAVWVATFDLVGRQAEVNTLYEVPELSNRVHVEPPVEQKMTRSEETATKISGQCIFLYKELD